MPSGIGTALVAGGLGAAGSIIGGNKAASAVTDASAQSVAEQRRQFDIATGLSRPGIEAGDAARNQLLALLGISAPAMGAGRSGFQQSRIPSHILDKFPEGEFPGLRSGILDRQNAPQSGGAVSADPLSVIQNTPGYQFQLEQGTRALNANRSNRGASGGELLKDFSRFNQGVASSFYQDYANRLQDIATGGNAAANSSANRAINSGVNIGNTLQNAGNARASGVVGATNSFTNLLSELAGGYGSGAFSSPQTTSGGNFVNLSQGTNPFNALFPDT